VDPLGQHARLPAGLLDVPVEQTDDPRVELPEVARVELREGDPRHEVAAEDGLGVQARDRRELLARVELDQRADDAGRADVHGEAELHPPVSPRSTATTRSLPRPPGGANVVTVTP